MFLLNDYIHNLLNLIIDAIEHVTVFNPVQAFEIDCLSASKHESGGKET